MQFELKAQLGFALIIIVFVGGVAAFYVYNSRNTPSRPVSALCGDPASINSYVYNPSRLEIVKSCVIASGTVDDLRPERDGDYHVILRLDASYANLTNNANDDYQHGDLVVEIICALPVTQQDAVSACQGYANHVPVPAVGQHIMVSGPYVLDTEHYDWAEIHPVFSLSLS